MPLMGVMRQLTEPSTQRGCVEGFLAELHLLCSVESHDNGIVTLACCNDLFFKALHTAVYTQMHGTSLALCHHPNSIQPA